MFVTKCDQEKHFHVAPLALKVVFGCPMTSPLLRDHVLLSVKEQLRIVLCLSLVEGGGNPMENPKVKTKLRHPPNLIPGIDIRCFA